MRNVIVLVVDQTLMIVSSAHGVPSSSIVPPQMSTTVSPSWTTHTDAPTSLPRVEVGGEHVRHRGEPLVEGPVDVGHGGGTYPLGVQPSGGSIWTSRSAGCQPSPGV